MKLMLVVGFIYAIIYVGRYQDEKLLKELRQNSKQRESPYDD